jgi:alkylation response protein AidB-like acyl-CoA dehydrogenase
MDFRLTDDQRALRTGVRELLAARFGHDALRAAVDREGTVDRALWRELGEAGFFALRLPEADGGAGAGLPEAVLAYEEAGRALLNGPLVATHLAAGRVAGAADGARVVTCATQLPGFVAFRRRTCPRRGPYGPWIRSLRCTGSRARTPPRRRGTPCPCS